MTIKALVATLLLLTGMTLAQTVTVTGTVDDPNGLPYANGNGVATLVSGNGSGSQSWTTGGTNPVNPTRPISGFDSFGKFSIDLTNTAAIDQQSAQPVWVFNLCSNVNTVPSQLCFKLPGLALTVSQDITTQINAVPPPALPGSGGSCGHNCYPLINVNSYNGADIGAKVAAAITANSCGTGSTGCSLIIPAGTYSFSTAIVIPQNTQLYCANVAGWSTVEVGGATTTTLTYTGTGDAITLSGVHAQNIGCNITVGSGATSGIKMTASNTLVDHDYLSGGGISTKLININCGGPGCERPEVDFSDFYGFIGDAIYCANANDATFTNIQGGATAPQITSVAMTVDSQCNGVKLTKGSFGNSGLHQLVISDSLSTGAPTWAVFNLFEADCARGGSGIYFDPSLSSQVLHTRIELGWAAGSGQDCQNGTSAPVTVGAAGIEIDGGIGITIDNAEIRSNVGDGVLINGASVGDVIVTNNHIWGNNFKYRSFGSDNGDYNGIRVSAIGALGAIFTGNYLGNFPGSLDGHQHWGIKWSVTNPLSNLATSNNFQDNTVGAYTYVTGGTSDLYPSVYGNATPNTGPTPQQNMIGDLAVTSLAIGAQSSPHVIPNYGTADGLQMGFGTNCYFDGTNWHFATDGSSNGGSCLLGLQSGPLALYSVPVNGTPASDQTISAAALSSYKQLTVSPITGLASKSYNTVLQADQYCTTPGTLDQTCLANAVSALPGSGGAIHMRAGTYTFSSLVTISIPSGVCYTLFGDGQDLTVVSAATTDAIAFNYGNSQSCVTISDLTVATGANGTSKGISLNAANANSNPALGPMSNVTRVGFRGSDGWTATHYWATALNMVNVSNVNVESINISGSASALGTGISFAGNSSLPSYAVVLNISKSNINWLSHGFVYGSYVQGVTIDQSNFTADTTAIAVPFGETGSLDQFNILDNQFGAGSAGQTSLIFGTAVGSVNVHNNLMFVGASGNAINYIGGNATFIGNQIFCTSNSGSTGVALASISAPLTFSGNQVGGCQAGIAIDSTDAFMSITGNNLYSNTAAISGTSTATTNFISGNPGYNPVGVSSPTPSASPWTYANGPSPAACYARATTGISQISVGGVNTLSTALGAGVMGSINLGPNEAAIITYTGTATLVCSVH